MNKLPKRHFWEWFKRHNKEYLEVYKKSKKEATFWKHELSAHLRAWHKFFRFSLELYDKEPARLTITVHGRAEYFKKVEAFVATAPEIPGWNIRALEDPVPVDFLLEELMEEAGIDPRECYFSFIGKDGKDIIVYHPLCTKDNGFLFLQLANAAVFNLLGERSFGMDIGDLVVDNLSCADADNIHELLDLPTHIGLRKSDMGVDHNGNLLSMQ
jgi:hypothetical protein